MSLPIPDVERELTQTRRIRFESYKRADGLWDIDGHLNDVKNHDYALRSGVRRAGQPVHGMALRLTIDTDFKVVAAVAAIDAVPYPGGCDTIVPAYRGLVGLNLLHKFRQRVSELFGGTQGCTHMTEMLAYFPTVAIQTLAGEQNKRQGAGDKPFELDQCHALVTTSETVRKWYPQWHRQPGDADSADKRSEQHRSSMNKLSSVKSGAG